MAKKSAVERFCEEAETPEDRELCETMRNIPSEDNMLRRAIVNYVKSARKSSE